ncbi:hypothetical protein ACFQU1_07090 [Chelatococcus sp. GCM10030263]|uniref:hypothetical protein n=1 Tax=Chelatococcus sp. GCM10030263 TaxID=3273387 RepID=UPI003622A5BF
MASATGTADRVFPDCEDPPDCTTARERHRLRSGFHVWRKAPMTFRHSVLAAVSIAAGLGFHIDQAEAQQRIEAGQRSCSALQNLVQRNGHVLLYTGPYLYDTYVTSCGIRQSQVPAYLQSRDNPQCLVGYTCGPLNGGN